MNLQGDLFHKSTFSKPLAYRLRPRNLKDFYGQKKVLDFLAAYEGRQLPHLILWGPPGTGKTTLAHIIAGDSKFFSFNAVTSGVPALRKLIDEIKEQREVFGQDCVLFIDEIHRFNKAQQDALLPHLERGDFHLIGATTEYPQTSLNRAILSRVRPLALEKLNEESIVEILQQAAIKEKKQLNNNIIKEIARYTNGDARRALNLVEIIWESEVDQSNQEKVDELLAQNSRLYDKNSDRHYDVISAYIKSIRGSDPNAAVLWLAVMLEGGEDPRFIARRLVIAASEDVGNANPQALVVATSALNAIKEIGMPEARIILSQATIYVASSPKSNACYLAINEAMAFVSESPTIEVPTHLRNHHPDKKNYKFAHNYPNHFVKQTYSPISDKFYRPTEQGSEKLLKERLNSLQS